MEEKQKTAAGRPHCRGENDKRNSRCKAEVEKMQLSRGQFAFRRKVDPIVESACGGLHFWVTHYDVSANMTTNTTGL